jgi:hypothetical protein
MNPPKVILNAKPSKEWFEIVGRGLERHNTAATGNVEYYPVCFLIREAGNHVRGGRSPGARARLRSDAL